MMTKETEERFQALLEAEQERTNHGLSGEKRNAEQFRRSGDGFGGRFFNPQETVSATVQGNSRTNTGTI